MTTPITNKRNYDADKQKSDIKKTERTKEKRAEVGNLRITELGSEEETLDSQNE